MIEKLKTLESLARRLQPSSAQRTEWHQQVADYASEFLKNLEEKKAFKQASSNRSENARDFFFSVEERASSLADLLSDIAVHIDQYGINPASAGHMGYIPGGGIYPSALGDYLAAVTNRYAGVFFASPGAVNLENDLLKWMCQLMGFPEDSVGNLTSGGSIANLTAIVTARESHHLRARDFERAVVYLTEQTHHSVQKAIRISGLSECKIRYVDTDSRNRMSPTVLDKSIRQDKQKGLLPFFINATLGTTNTGAVDPINDIAKVASEQALWLHVDAAYGGFFKLVEGMSNIFSGIEKADSITLDPHKTLFLPFGTGAVLIKNKKALMTGHHYQADYMQDTISEFNEPSNSFDRNISPADISPELSKHFRGMRLWLPLKLFGLAPFRAALEEKLILTQYLYQQLASKDGFEVGPEPQLSVTIFRYVPAVAEPNQFNETLIKRIQIDGDIFLSSTLIDQVFWIRVAIVNFRTHLSHVNKMIKIVEAEVKATIANDCVE